MRQIGAECLGNKRIIQPGGKRWRHLGLGRQIGKNERWWHGNLPAAQQGFCRRLIEHYGIKSGGSADGRRVIKTLVIKTLVIKIRVIKILVIKTLIIKIRVIKTLVIKIRVIKIRVIKIRVIKIRVIKIRVIKIRVIKDQGGRWIGKQPAARRAVSGRSGNRTDAIANALHRGDVFCH